jgi:histidine triad (HIT) family protein
MELPCKFCRISSRPQDSSAVFEDEVSLAFLDHKPLFPGHCLLVPKDHYQTLSDLPARLHIRVVPRRRQAGLKGFFWPR